MEKKTHPIETVSVDELDAVAGGCGGSRSSRSRKFDIKKMLLVQLMFGPNGLFNNGNNANSRRRRR